MRIRYTVLTALMTLTAVIPAFGSGQTDTPPAAGETISIESYNGAREVISLTIPKNPRRVAILDMASLDIIDALGMGDRVVGTASTSIDYLRKYSDDSSLAKLGTVKEADLEAVMRSNPDVIFIGGRLAPSYDALSEIAPVVFLETATEAGLYETVKKNAATIASIFSMEAEAADMMAHYEKQIGELRELAAGKTAIIGMCTMGGFNVLGDNGRCSIIGNEIGFTNVGVEMASSMAARRSGSRSEGGSRPEGGAPASQSTASNAPSHGNEVSFEFLVDRDPDYVFILDRDAAIGTNGVKPARDIMENELVRSTSVYQNGNLVYLGNPGIWYTAEGGIRAFGYMLQDLEAALN